MSELIPSEKTIKVTDKIIELFIEENISLADAEDVPAELTRRINRNIHRLKEKTDFKLLR